MAIPPAWTRLSFLYEPLDKSHTTTKRILKHPLRLFMSFDYLHGQSTFSVLTPWTTVCHQLGCTDNKWNSPLGSRLLHSTVHLAQIFQSLLPSFHTQHSEWMSELLPEGTWSQIKVLIFKISKNVLNGR